MHMNHRKTFIFIFLHNNSKILHLCRFIVWFYRVKIKNRASSKQSKAGISKVKLSDYSYDAYESQKNIYIHIPAQQQQDSAPMQVYRVVLPRKPHIRAMRKGSACYQNSWVVGATPKYVSDVTSMKLAYTSDLMAREIA